MDIVLAKDVTVVYPPCRRKNAGTSSGEGIIVCPAGGVGVGDRPERDVRQVDDRPPEDARAGAAGWRSAAGGLTAV
jgi:hypothetical protein